MKKSLLLSLLFLTGCSWFSGGEDSPIYTANWELDDHQALQACDGTIPVNYHMTQCFKNGLETNLSECSGLIKLPAQINSPAGTQNEDIKNYLEEVIGQRTYTCDQGSSRQIELSSVTCSDTRYIKQNLDNVEDCNPFVIDLENLLTSEHRVLSTVFDSGGQIVNYINRNNLVIPGFSKGKIFDQETGLFYKLISDETALVLDYLYNSKPVKDWTADCALFQDGTFDCNTSIFLFSPNRYISLYDNADKIFQGQNRGSDGLAVSKKGNKYYFRSFMDNSVYEIPQLENKEVIKVFNHYICYQEDNIFCLTLSYNENVPGSLEFVLYYEGANVLDGNFGWLCIKNQNGGISCKGDSPAPYSGIPNETTDLREISSLNIKELYNNRALTNDNKLFLFKNGSFQEIYLTK